jgi:hypothetical protein
MIHFAIRICRSLMRRGSAIVRSLRLPVVAPAYSARAAQSNVGVVRSGNTNR